MEDVCWLQVHGTMAGQAEGGKWIVGCRLVMPLVATAPFVEKELQGNPWGYVSKTFKDNLLEQIHIWEA